MLYEVHFSFMSKIKNVLRCTACKLDEGFLVHLMRLDLRILSETTPMLVAEMGDLHLPSTRWTVD